MKYLIRYNESITESEIMPKCIKLFVDKIKEFIGDTTISYNQISSYSEFFTIHLNELNYQNINIIGLKDFLNEIQLNTNETYKCEYRLDKDNITLMINITNVIDVAIDKDNSIYEKLKKIEKRQVCLLLNWTYLDKKYSHLSGEYGFFDQQEKK
jgi:hypothetical protein